MSKWYGSIDNRLEENRNHLGREIRVGDDITEYLWSDRHCYYVTRVDSQKHIFVKPYQVCADQDKAGGMGHQDWLYFKTIKEEHEYLNKHFPEKGYPTENINEPAEIELAFRYNHWYKVSRMFYGQPLEKPMYERMNISFGVRDYYYDWEF